MPIDLCATKKCPNGYQCMVFELGPTREAYCQPNCSLNNGGCPADQECRIKPVYCVRAPCPPFVECVEKTTACPPTCSKEFCSRKGNRRAMCSRWVLQFFYVFVSCYVRCHELMTVLPSFSLSLSPPPSLALVLKRSQAVQDLVSWPTVMPAITMRSHTPLQNTARSVRNFKTIWQTQDAFVVGQNVSGSMSGYLAIRYKHNMAHSY